jgi:SAM-dependent methyltransferase
LGLKREFPTGALFDEISSYWEEIADANATEKQVNFVKKHVAAVGLVLDLGCGNGRHAVAMGKSGYDMVGLDVSLHLLETAKTKAAQAGVRLGLVRAYMRFLPFQSCTFSAVVSLDSSFGYLPSEEEDLKSFGEVARTLAAGGFVLVDVFNRDRIVQRYGKKLVFGFWSRFFGLLPKLPWLAGLFRWREYPSFWLLQKRSANAESGLLRDLWVFRDKKTGKITVTEHIIRLYGFSQLKTLVERAGLRVLKTFGNYEREEYKLVSSRLILIAVKAVGD